LIANLCTLGGIKEEDTPSPALRASGGPGRRPRDKKTSYSIERGTLFQEAKEKWPCTEKPVVCVRKMDHQGGKQKRAEMEGYPPKINR